MFHCSISLSNAYLCSAGTYHSGSFTKAAKKLFMTPQGLSKSIKSLEEELGTELLSRSSKGVSLTENGHVFLESAQSLYD